MMQDKLSLFYNAKIASSLIDDTEDYLELKNGTMLEDFLPSDQKGQAQCFALRMRDESIHLFEDSMKMIHRRHLDQEWIRYLYSKDNEFAIERGMFDVYCALCDSCFGQCGCSSVCSCSLRGLAPQNDEPKEVQTTSSLYTDSL